jgi:hypothetical protein
MWDRTEKIIFVIAFIFIAFFTRDQLWNPNDMSRMAGVESIVERGTFAIDNSTFVNTIDKVKSGEHYYSDKPAMSYLVAVPVYYVLHRFFDLDFAHNRNLTYYLVTLFTVGISICIMLVYFYRLLGRFNLDKSMRIFYTASMYLGTLVFPFSLVYSNHGLATALVVITFYALLNAKTSEHYLYTGLLSGFLATIDLVLGSIFSILFFIWIFVKARRKTTLFIAGAVIPVLVTLLINYSISGSIIPFNVNTQLFDFKGSAFGPGSLSGIVAQPLSEIGSYAFDLTLGKRGFLSFTPVLVFSLAGLIIALFRKKYRNEAMLVLAGTIATLVFYITRTNNHGGCSYGLRWTVPLIPLIYLFTPLIFAKKFKFITTVKILFVIVLVVSICFALLGAMEPWTCSQGLVPDFLIEQLKKKFIPGFIQSLLQ